MRARCSVGYLGIYHNRLCKQPKTQTLLLLRGDPPPEEASEGGREGGRLGGWMAW